MSTVQVSEMSTTDAFSSKREVHLALMEVNSDNVWRYSLKLMRTFKAGILTLEELGGCIENFEKYCKTENVDTRHPLVIMQEEGLLSVTAPFIKRFKIVDPSGAIATESFYNLKEVMEALENGKRNPSLQVYYIEDSVSDVSVTSDELILAWRAGERPTDLEMF
jgi:hypothetical protein